MTCDEDIFSSDIIIESILVVFKSLVRRLEKDH